MKRCWSLSQTLSVALLFILSSITFSGFADIDENKAKMLARQNNCFKCHGITKEKDGPAYTKVAEKYRDKENAEARLIEHITSGETAKFPDGHEEEHKIIKTRPPGDMAQIRNLVQWILAQ